MNRSQKYLKLRGWIPVPSCITDQWCTPRFYLESEPLNTRQAVTVQYAEDTKELRDAWVQFASHAGNYADALLADFRDRFMFEIDWKAAE